MKSIILAIINIFRALIIVLMGMAKAVVTLPKTVYGQINTVLAMSGDKADSYKVKGGWKNYMVGFGYTLAGAVISAVYLLYAAIIITNLVRNPVNAIASILGGATVTAVFVSMVGTRDENGLLVM